MDTIAVDPYYTLIVATLVLLVGRLMVDRIKFLQDFNIPEPVAGGLLAAVIIYILHVSTGVSFAFDKGLQDSFMLIFFSSIGLSADFSRLKAGGVGLVLFLLVVSAFIVVQNVVGVGLAGALGLAWRVRWVLIPSSVWSPAPSPSRAVTARPAPGARCWKNSTTSWAPPTWAWPRPPSAWCWAA